jgi:hypothetical protein
MQVIPVDDKGQIRETPETSQSGDLEVAEHPKDGGEA